MKKYLIAVVLASTLMITSVYALNNNNDINTTKQTTYNQNCPYHNEENCPYYNETTETKNCPNNNTCENNYNSSGHQHNRQGKHHRHHQ